MADVAAIRNTLFDNPEDMAVYCANLRVAATAMPMPLVEEVSASYDDLIQEIADSQRYAN